MKHKSIFTFSFLIIGLTTVVLLFRISGLVGAQEAINTTFTYQGRLVKDSQYIDDNTCDFQFSLYNSPTVGEGTALGAGVQSVSGVPVDDGYFTVHLNFGDVFDGSQRYLQVAVQCPPDVSFTTLSPRTTLHAAPYASYAQNAPWTGITGMPDGFADGVDNGETYNSGGGITMTNNVISASLASDGGLEFNTSQQMQVEFAGSGAAAAVARSDHAHDADYVNEGQIAGGDLGGSYPNPNVTGLQGQPVAVSAPTADEVLKWDGFAWTPGVDNGITHTAGSGIVITGSTISADFAGTGTAQTVAHSDHDHDTDYINTGEAAGGDLSGMYPNPIVTGLQGKPISIGTPTAGEILRWDGLVWGPGRDNNTTYTAGSGIDISVANVISANFTTVGDNNGIADTVARGDHVHDDRYYTEAESETRYLNSGEVAGGDLAGTYPNPLVMKLYGLPLGPTPPATGQVLKWTGSAWAPGVDNGATYTASSGISIVGNVISVSLATDGGLELDGNQQLQVQFGDSGVVSTAARSDHNHDATYINAGETAGGDLTGTYPDPLVTKLYGQPLAYSTPPATNQVLKWNGWAWGPAADNIATYTAGNGISIVSNIVSANFVPVNSNNGSAITVARSDHIHDTRYYTKSQTESRYVNSGETAGGDLTGTYPNPQLATDTVGTAEIANNSVDLADTVNWMGAIAASATFSSGDYIYLYGLPFTPSADGSCLVFASAAITSTGTASAGLPPVLDTVVSRGGGAPQEDGNPVIAFAPGDITTDQVTSASANSIFSVNSGEATQFGCRVNDPDGTGTDWGTAETLTCRIAYICQ